MCCVTVVGKASDGNEMAPSNSIVMPPSAFPSTPLALRSSRVVVSGYQRESHAIRASSYSRYYRACERCHHVQVADAGPIIPGFAKLRIRLTPRWSDPAWSPWLRDVDHRARWPRSGGIAFAPAPADEARLITVPRGDLFCEGDVPGVRFAHMSGSPRPDTPGMEGRLVVINSRPRGTIVPRCVRCVRGASASCFRTSRGLSAQGATNRGRVFRLGCNPSGAAGRPRTFLRD